MIYKILSRTNTLYDLPAMTRLELLFNGGQKILKAANLFIQKHNKEHPAAYDDRLSEAVYPQFFSYICNYYATTVFEKELTIQRESAPDDPFYEAFSSNCDGAGTELQDFLKQRFTEALAYKRSYVGLDFPVAKPVEEGASDADITKPMPYLYCIDQKDIIDWKHDSYGNLTWCRVHRKYQKEAGPLEPDPMTVTEVKVWSMGAKTAQWETYAAEHKSPDHVWPDSTDFPLTAQGTTDFPVIPIFCLTIDDGLNFGSRIADLCAALFRLKTTNSYAERRSAYPVPVMKVAGPAMESSGDMTPGATNVGELMQRAAQARDSQGIIRINATEELEYLQASADTFVHLQAREESLTNMIFQLASMSSQSVATTSQQALSAAAKQQDNLTLNNNCEEFGSLCKQFGLKLVRVIAATMGDEDDFVALGLDNYNHIDRDTALQEALASSVLAQNLPSETFAVDHALMCITNLMASTTRKKEAVYYEELMAGLKKRQAELEEQKQVNDEQESEDSSEA